MVPRRHVHLLARNSLVNEVKFLGPISKKEYGCEIINCYMTHLITAIFLKLLLEYLYLF